MPQTRLLPTPPFPSPMSELAYPLESSHFSGRDCNVNNRQSQPLTQPWSTRDPRSLSVQSLVPRKQERSGRRTLLLVYIHGFMGNELSFQSFPAHVHNLVGTKLAESHVVHTKIYPRYKSREAIEFARDDFSDW